MTKREFNKLETPAKRLLVRSMKRDGGMGYRQIGKELGITFQMAQYFAKPLPGECHSCLQPLPINK